MQNDDRCLASEAVAYLSAHGVEHPARKILQCLTTGELRASGYFTYEIQGERETSRWERARGDTLVPNVATIHCNRAEGTCTETGVQIADSQSTA